VHYFERVDALDLIGLMLSAGLVEVYEKAAADFGWKPDKELIKRLTEKNDAAEKKIDEK
jgi:hypothetical protein